MAVTRQVQRTLGQFLPNGATPLAAAANNTMSTGGGGFTSFSSLRLRTDIELYVIAGGGTTDVDLSFADETVMIVGGLLTDGGSVTTSPTPITDAQISPFTGQLGNWGQWEYLYPDVQFVNVNVPQTVLVTWRPKGSTIDTQFRRRNDSINGIDLWMPWEVQNGSGLINTTDAGGNTYFLGARFAQEWVYETRS
jgi:hypothetical protein